MMHPSLQYYSSHSKMDILQSEEDCKSFLEFYRIIPSRSDPTPPCPKCKSPTTCLAHPSYKLGWNYRCSKRKAKVDRCFGSINPLVNTFFENVKISFQDVLSLIFFFVDRHPVMKSCEDITNWRLQRNLKTLSNKTACDFFSLFRETAEIISSHFSGQFGGPNKTVELDETFLTKRKYSRGINICVHYFQTNVVIYITHFFFLAYFFKSMQINSLFEFSVFQISTLYMESRTLFNFLIRC